MKRTAALVVVASALLSGCAFHTSPYGASPQTNAALKSANLKPMAVTEFKAANPGQNSITCRAAGPVQVQPNFETYIQKAFIDELRLAGLYDPAAPIKISGFLQAVDFSSGMSTSWWKLTLVVSNQAGASFSTTSSSAFSGSFIADRACQQIAQEFAPAVQKLINEVVTNPKFKEIAGGN